MRMLTLVATLTAVCSVLAQTPPSYRVGRTYRLGGDGSWVCLLKSPYVLAPLNLPAETDRLWS